MEEFPEVPLNPAGSSCPFSFHTKFPPWASGQVSPGAPTSRLIWGLHQPACQHSANLAQLSGPWIPQPGLQPTPFAGKAGKGSWSRLWASANVCTQEYSV